MLKEQRLLATDVSQDTGEVTIEPAHETLLRQWELLQGWLAEDAGLLGVLEGVKRASRDWAANARDPAWLSHATSRLAAAENLRQRPDIAASLEPTDRDYLAACRERELNLRRQRVRNYSALGVLALAAFVGLGIAGWAKFDALVVYKSWTADRFSSQVLSPEKKELALAPAASFAECSYCPVMVVVPAGTFAMGSPPEETPANRRFYDNERPQHQVVIEQPFAVGRFEVTFEQWDACYYLGGCTTRPGDEGWGRGNQPVVNINWDDARQYVAWLSRQTGKPYRLLTESEWEYAARAGTQTPYAFGYLIDGKANCDGCGSRWDNERTAPVGSFAPNAFGLHDMHGNVWELVEDCYRDSYQGAPSNSATVHVEGCRDHVVRGGSFYNFKLNVRTAVRTRWHAGASKADVLDPDDPDTPAKAMGLRVARTLLVKR